MRWIASGLLVAFAFVSVWIALNLLVASGDEGQTRGGLIAAGIVFALVAIGAAYSATWVFRRSPR